MDRYKKILLNPRSTIKEALQVIDSGAIKIALVVDRDQKFLGTLTDGDIRRGLLKNLDLSDTIEGIIFRTPVVCHVNDTKEKILETSLSSKIYQIPILNDDGELVGFEETNRFFQSTLHKNKVVLMAGGLGTRLRPLTNSVPKPLLKVGNKPIIETIIERFAKHGFKDFLFSVNYKAEMFEEYFGDGSRFGVSIEYIYEDKRLGTAGALSLMRDKLKDDFFVMNGDILTNINFEDLLRFHQEDHAMGTMCVRKYDFQVPYGVVNIDEGKIKSITEKPIHEFFVNAGIYMLSSKVLKYIPNDEFYDMPTLFEKLIEKKENTISFPLREYWLDIGRIEEFKKANDDYQVVFDV